MVAIFLVKGTMNTYNFNYKGKSYEIDLNEAMAAHYIFAGDSLFSIEIDQDNNVTGVEKYEPNGSSSSLIMILIADEVMEGNTIGVISKDSNGFLIEIDEITYIIPDRIAQTLLPKSIIIDETTTVKVELTQKQLKALIRLQGKGRLT